MIMIKRFAALISFAIFALSTPVMAQSNGPVVVELFTSQSCSSCPPADKLLGELAAQDNVIALACPVTYWNHLNWKDTLSRQSCTDRQREYARRMGKNNVYTPQMVVNGQDEFIGSRGRTARNSITKAAAIKAISLQKSGQGTLIADLPDLPPDSYELTLFGTSNQEIVGIKSGENRGRTVEYTNVVTLHKALGDWSGAAENKDISLEPSQNIQNLVVLAQSKHSGEIFAAGKISY